MEMNHFAVVERVVGRERPLLFIISNTTLFFASLCFFNVNGDWRLEIDTCKATHPFGNSTAGVWAALLSLGGAIFLE